MDEVMTGPGARVPFDGPLAEERALLANAKKLSLFCAGAASQKFGTDLGEQQEVMGMLADMLAEVLVLESVLLRTEKMNGSKPLAIKLARYYAARSFRVVETAAERLLGAIAEGDMLRTQMAILRRLAKREPVNTVALGRDIAGAIVAAGRYTLESRTS
jgi:butyryl-CoA dehydrogenase